MKSLERPVQVAEARQIRSFFAEVLSENGDMLTIFRDRFAADAVVGRGEVEIEFPTSNWRRAEACLQS